MPSLSTAVAEIVIGILETKVSRSRGSNPALLYPAPRPLLPCSRLTPVRCLSYRRLAFSTAAASLTVLSSAAVVDGAGVELGHFV